jgi:hypothetical protein
MLYPDAHMDFSTVLTADLYYNRTDANGTIYRQDAAQGQMFLKIVMTIKNNGYTYFTTDPTYFKIFSSNYGVTYFMAGMGYSDVTNWTTVNVGNGETYTGTMLLQLPKDALSLTPGYQNFDVPYHSVWRTDWGSSRPPF